jgi:lipopolysaccharide transport system permease protein
MINEWLKEIWSYRELFYFLCWRDTKIRYKQTVLGAAWAIIQPLFTMVVFTFLFGKLAKMPSDDIPYPIFSYSALLPWTYFAGAINAAGNSLVGNANLLRKVYFPREVLPTSSVLSGLVGFGIASVILLIMMVYYQMRPDWELLLWPVLMIPLVMLALGIGMILSALNVKYRDIRHATPFFINLWLFMTPVIYPTSIIPDHLQVLSALNPLSGIIEAFRASLFTSRQVNWQALGISCVVVTFTFTLGILYFKKTERFFADIV